MIPFDGLGDDGGAWIPRIFCWVAKLERGWNFTSMRARYDGP